jgi:hypothetical protein
VLGFALNQLTLEPFRGGVMSKRSDLWRQAQVCMSLARVTNDPALKEQYEDLAVVLARKAERERFDSAKTSDSESGNTSHKSEFFISAHPPGCHLLSPGDFAVQVLLPDARNARPNLQAAIDPDYSMTSLWQVADRERPFPSS